MVLANKIIVITGAASGIGREIAKKALGRGATVCALDVDKTRLAVQQEAANKYKQPFHSYVSDVSNYEQLSSTARLLFKEIGPADVWINNAGISGLGDFSASSLEKIESVFKVNLMGTIYGTRIALEKMETLGRGVIVNIDSVAGHIPAPYLSLYCASKHGVAGFSGALREELKLKSSPIGILSVSPGFVDTKMIERGTEHGFPEWLHWALSSPETVATEIIRAIEKDAENISGTLNGKILLHMNRFLPKTTRKSSRLLLAKNLRDLVLLRKHPPG